MQNKEAKAVVPEEPSFKRQNQFLQILKRLSYNRGAMIGTVLFTTVVIIALIAPLIVPYNYSTVNVKDRFISPCSEHWFGTDNLGRDLFSRILIGARYSLAIGIGSVLISSCLGMVVGSIAGFFGGWVDNIIMRLCDVIQSIPGMLLNIAMSCIFGPGVFNTILALGIGGIVGTARLMRASILNVRKMEYLDAATASNCSNVRIIVKHIIPNTFSPLIVQATMGVGGRIMAAAGLSYIGIGVQPPTPEWGALLSDSRSFMQKYPYMTLIPGACIAIVVLSLNLMGDGLRDAIDPKLKK